ncbi:GNAT family N-acetyltransferase [Aquabacter sp. L1I39]|uniref:GNAT family N-acetyltransferase n=1 Tax=Aquabacter sp. L1I39 TaxID=2820278 RepID=UPI001ADCDC3D|nr:N-acetyltransferase [Aquabacter sp. L1I39]QTL04918.1 GNAT family N-acetyltransferase [Aquabacter sp. L1I39]
MTQDASTKDARPPFHVTPYEPGQRAALADLWVASWAKTMPEIDFEARRPWFLGHFETLRQTGAEILVAVPAETGARGGLPAGFVAIAPATGYLDQLAVAPAFWGKGAAEVLMAAARQVSPAGIALDVNQDNPRAVAFYRRLGFAIAAEGRNPLSGRAIWRMEWKP